jgi:hypothetical protein
MALGVMPMASASFRVVKDGSCLRRVRIFSLLLRFSPYFLAKNGLVDETP